MEFSGCGFKSHSGQLSIDTSKNPSVVNTIDIYIYVYYIHICIFAYWLLISFPNFLQGFYTHIYVPGRSVMSNCEMPI